MARTSPPAIHTATPLPHRLGHIKPNVAHQRPELQVLLHALVRRSFYLDAITKKERIHGEHYNASGMRAGDQTSSAPQAVLTSRRIAGDRKSALPAEKTSGERFR